MIPPYKDLNDPQVYITFVKYMPVGQQSKDAVAAIDINITWNEYYNIIYSQIDNSNSFQPQKIDHYFIVNNDSLVITHSQL